MRLRAPAKINWTLEVLGRRDDGYHEVRTVMQTIDLCDTVRARAEERPVDRAPPVGAGRGPFLALRGGNLRIGFEASEMWPGGPGDSVVPGSELIHRAATLLDPDWKRVARINIAKQIPWVAGLGGSSSDAAAALRGLKDVWGLGQDEAGLMEMAAEIGSDVPFFLRGGTALAEGRGERVTPLPEPPPSWLVILAPPISLPEKTKRMYASLRPADFSDGSRTEALLRRLRAGRPIEDETLCNAFERAAYETFEGLDGYREALLSAGARRVHLAGSGPALFALGPDEAEASAIRKRLRAPGGEAFVVQTLTAAEALTRDW